MSYARYHARYHGWFVVTDRLCPNKPGQVSEGCFQKHPLKFAGNTRWLQHMTTGARFEMPLVKVSTGTFPPGSEWARTPFPGCAGGPCDADPLTCQTKMNEADTCANANLEFPAPLPGAYGWGAVGTQGFHYYSIIDRVVIPDNLTEGEYLLSWRWDAEQTAQIWQNCADISIAPPSPPAKYDFYPGRTCYKGSFGCTDIDTGDGAGPVSLADCKARCDSDPTCGCVTYQPAISCAGWTDPMGGRCWKRADCKPTQFDSQYGAKYDMYVMTQPPVPWGGLVWDKEPFYNVHASLLLGQRLDVYHLSGKLTLAGGTLIAHNVNKSVPDMTLTFGTGQAVPGQRYVSCSVSTKATRANHTEQVGAHASIFTAGSALSAIRFADGPFSNADELKQGKP